MIGWGDGERKADEGQSGLESDEGREEQRPAHVDLLVWLKDQPVGAKVSACVSYTQRLRP